MIVSEFWLFEGVSVINCWLCWHVKFECRLHGVWAIQGTHNLRIFDMPLYKRLRFGIQSITLWVGMVEDVLKLHRENPTKNTIHSWLQLWQGGPHYPNRGKEYNLEKNYYKHKEIYKKVRIKWRKPGWQDIIRRASRDRREETIQLQRQMGVITISCEYQVFTVMTPQVMGITHDLYDTE